MGYNNDTNGNEKNPKINRRVRPRPGFNYPPMPGGNDMNAEDFIGINEFMEESMPTKTKKDKYSNVKWFSEPVYYVAEINKDGAWMNSYMFMELGGYIPGVNDSDGDGPDIDLPEPIRSMYGGGPISARVMVMGPNGFMPLSKLVRQQEDVKVMIALHEGKLMIKRANKGIMLTYDESTNKAFFEFVSLKDVYQYFEYAIDGLWVFKKDRHADVFIGTKAEAK